MSPHYYSKGARLIVENNIALEMKNISKRFVGVYALNKMNLQLIKGEVHALLGENGAGKSTLIKILGGIYIADEGQFYINGKETKINSIYDARNNGISIIHQEIALVPHISIAENIFLGREPVTKFGLKDIKKMNEEATKMAMALGLNIDVRQEVFSLSIAQKQMVEIIKAVSFQSNIIVMDEPTSSISDKEVEMLFKIIQRLKSQGVSIIYISHKLDELFAMTDRVTILRDGKYIATKVIKETNKEELIKLMVGRDLEEYYTHTERQLQETMFEVKKLNKKGVFKNISFQVRKGEIVGFSGLVGAGRTEIMKAIFGIDKLDSGDIYLEGKQIKIKNVKDAIDYGIALIPEDRKKEGLILKNTVGFNITVTVQDKFKKFIMINKMKRDGIIDKYIKALSIKTPTTEQLAFNLSGGNQQKIVLAKWLATDPKVLILDEPTRGVDVGAKSEIYTIIDKLARGGMAVIIISSELPEILNTCDRVYVVSQGEITGEISRDEFSQEKIMHYATGGN